MIPLKVLENTIKYYTTKNVEFKRGLKNFVKFWDYTRWINENLKLFFFWKLFEKPGVSLRVLINKRRRFPTKVEPRGFFLKIWYCEKWKSSGVCDFQIRVILLLLPKHSRNWKFERFWTTLLWFPHLLYRCKTRV